MTDDSATASRPPGPGELTDLDRYWRAANYLSVGQIYLLDNPLLREPLRPEHIKPRLLGHWGTTPGLNFICAHLNRVIRARDLDMIYVCGPGHGGPGMVANTYLEGSYSEIYPEIGQDLDGLRKLFRQFSFPGGIPSHASPETPGSIHEAANWATRWCMPMARPYSCYEAFIHIVDSMVNQHAKWLKVSRALPWRRPIASLNYLLTSHVWRQDHNGFSHQDPGFVDLVANKKADIGRIYLPPDASTLLWVAHHCLGTYGPAMADDRSGRDPMRGRHRHLVLGGHRVRGRRTGRRHGLRRRRARMSAAFSPMPPVKIRPSSPPKAAPSEPSSRPIR